MKFGVLKFAFLALLASVLVVVLAGCGASSNLNLPQGNWSMTATTSGTNGPFYIGGNLTQNGTSLTGTMAVVSSLCFSSSQIVTFTGTVKGNNVTLTSASVGGEVITVTATGTTSSALTGTYTIAGGTTCNGDTGTITANPVPSISGTWSGPIVSKGGSNVTLALALTQAATASSDGTFALTGTGTYTNDSLCFTSATVTSAFIAGPYLLVDGTTNDGGNFFYEQVLLNNPASPTSMKGTYSVSDPGGICDGDLDSPTFTKH